MHGISLVCVSNCRYLRPITHCSAERRYDSWHNRWGSKLGYCSLLTVITVCTCTYGVLNQLPGRSSCHPRQINAQDALVGLSAVSCLLCGYRGESGSYSTIENSQLMNEALHLPCVFVGSCVQYSLVTTISYWESRAPDHARHQFGYGSLSTAPRNPSRIVCGKRF